MKTTEQIIKSNKYKLDILKKWSWLEDKALKMMTQKVLDVTQGNIIDGIVYYNHKLTNLQCGKLEGYSNCLMEIDYMINEEKVGMCNG
jgi:hypothetical protein